MDTGIWLLLLCQTVPLIQTNSECCNPVSISGATSKFSSPETYEEYGESLSPNGLYYQSSWSEARPARVKQIFTLRYATESWELAVRTPSRPNGPGNVKYKSASTKERCPEDVPVLTETWANSGDNVQRLTVSCPGLGITAIVLIIVGILVLIICAMGGYYYYRKKQNIGGTESKSGKAEETPLN